MLHIRLLYNPVALIQSFVELFDLTCHISGDSDPEYADALRNKMHATKDLVNTFVRLGGQALETKEDLFRKCCMAQSEVSNLFPLSVSEIKFFPSKCISLRSELSLSRAKLRDVEVERDKYREDLAATERRLDRLQSNTVAVVQGRPTKNEMKAESPEPVPEPPAVSGLVNWWEFRVFLI